MNKSVTKETELRLLICNATMQSHIKLIEMLIVQELCHSACQKLAFLIQTKI